MKIRNPKKKKKEKREKRMLDNAAGEFDRTKYPSENLPPLREYPGKITKSPHQLEKWYRDATIYMRAYLAEGLSREEVKERLEINDRIYDEVEALLLETDGAKFINMGTAHRYYLHMLRQEQIVRELDEFTRFHMLDDPRKSGVVGALKAKSQIYDNLIKTGQELGIIAKRAKELRVLGELNLATMPDDSLRELFEERMEWFQNVLNPPQQLPQAYCEILDRSVSGQEDESNADKEEEESIIEVEYREETGS